MTNGEKYKTAQERAEEFHRFCEINVYGDCCKCGAFGNGKGGLTSCFLSWLDLEAAEEKPLPCPFCGRETHLSSYGETVSNLYIECDNCGYYSASGDTEEEVVSKHNRVAKAVKESEANHEAR